MKRLPGHGPCFVCGTENSHSIGIEWHVSSDGTVYGELTPTERQQGVSGLMHGGASAALLDEAMGAAVWQAGFRAVSVNLNINYITPIPLMEKITIIGILSGKNESGKSIYARGQIRLSDGKVAVQGQGIYVEAHQLIDKFTVY